MSSERSPRLAARALIVEDGRLLLVNAFPQSAERRGPESAERPGRGPLWCAPGGGVEHGDGLHDTLIREVEEETGLRIAPGPLAAVSEFRSDDGGFHQIDHFFHATRIGGAPGAAMDDHVDPAGVVARRIWATPQDMAALRIAPDFLPDLAFAPGPAAYRGMLRMIRP